jgi:multiple sugar transport system permease protein
VGVMTTMAAFDKGASKASLSKLRRQEERLGWLFVTPIVLGILIFQLYPTLFSLYVSFTEWNLLTPMRWVGWRNFVDLFTNDRNFPPAMYNSFVYTVGTVFPGIVLALLFAVLLNQNIRGRGIYRAIYFVPVVAPTVSVAILWAWIYEPDFGILNWLLGLVGIEGPQWLGSSDWAMFAVIIMSIWQGLGYNIVIFLAGLQAISPDLYEAAAIDGANAPRQFWHITLPLLSPVTFFVLVLGVIGALQVFAAPYVMTQGGPANATLTVVMQLYREAFQFQRMGLASAMAYVLFVLIVGLTLVNLYLQKMWVFYEEDN